MTGNRMGTSKAVARSGIALALVTYAAMNSFLVGGIGVVGRGVGLTEFECGLVLSLGAIFAMTSSPFWGMTCDRWGRRKTLLLALPMLSLAAAVLAMAFGGPYATVFALLLAGRLLQTVFGSAIIPTSQAVMADVTPMSRRTGGMAEMAAMLGLGTTAGSLLLATTSTRGIETGFVVLAVMGAAAFLMICLFFIDQAVPEDRRTAIAPLQLSPLLPSLTITAAGFAVYTMIVPLHGLRLLDGGGISPGQANAQAGWVLLAGGGGMLMAQATIALLWEPNPRMLVRMGSLGALPGLAALSISNSVEMMALSAALLGVCLGLAGTSNLALISLAVRPDAQGRAAGLNAAMRSLGIAIGPIIGLGLYQLGAHLPFVAGGVLIGVVVLASFRT